MQTPYVILVPDDFKKSHKVRIRKLSQVENHDNGFKLTYISPESGVYLHKIFGVEEYTGKFCVVSNKEDATIAGAQVEAQRTSVQNMFL